MKQNFIQTIILFLSLTVGVGTQVYGQTYGIDHSTYVGRNATYINSGFFDAGLNNPAINSGTSWSSPNGTGSANNQFVGYLLNGRHTIVSVSTRGRADQDQWVTSYNLEGTKNGTTWVLIGSYTGNTNRNTIVTNNVANTDNDWIGFRINPTGRNGYNSMRFQFNVIADNDNDNVLNGYTNLDDRDDDNDGIIDTNDGCTNPATMAITSGSYSVINGFNATFTFNQSAFGAISGTITSTGDSFRAAGGGITCWENRGNKNYDMNVTSQGSFYPTAFGLFGVVYENDGAVYNRYGGFIFTLADGTVINNPAATLTQNYLGAAPFGSPLGAFNQNGSTYYGDSSLNGSSGTQQGWGFVVFTQAVLNQIIAGGGVRRIQFTQLTTRGGDAGHDIAFYGTYAFCRDLDQDGLADHVDNDSDGDGCPDAIEGAGTFLAGDLDANNRLSGGVQTAPADRNGVPNAAIAGQEAGTSFVAATVTAPVLEDLLVQPGGALSLSVAATGSNATSYAAGSPVYGTPGNANAQITYQWYKGNPDDNGVLITNGGVYSGATSATLNISNTSGLIDETFYVVMGHQNNPCFRLVRDISLLDRCNPANGIPDTDGDGISNDCDLDDDNDGILDELEGTFLSANQQLNYEFYDGSFTSTNNIPTTGALATGTVNQIDNDVLQNAVDPGDTETYAFRYTGYIFISNPGAYTFFTTSDDGSRLFINNTQVVDNDFDQGPTERSGNITLTTGWHTIQLVYRQGGGGRAFSVAYQGPSIVKQALPFSILSSFKPGNGQLAYEFYDGSFTSTNNIPTTGALATGTVNQINNDVLQNAVDPGDADTYGIRYSGFIYIANPGTYTFFTTSDDGSRLFINNTQVVNNDFDQAATERSGTITLTSGWHAIQIVYREGASLQSLSVAYQGPSIAKQALPFSILSSFNSADRDFDGVINSLDNDADNDGVPDALEAEPTLVGSLLDTNGRFNNGINPQGIPSSANGGTGFTPVDKDGDGKPNYLDIDSDNDGIVDFIESQPTVGFIALSGTVNAAGIDNAFVNNGGVRTALIDTDNDDEADMFDTNSDDDTETDYFEAYDTNGNGAIAGGELVPSNADRDNDGLDNRFDLYNISSLLTGLNASNGTQTALSFPDTDIVGGEPNWRENICTNIPNLGTPSSSTAVGISTHTAKQANWPTNVPNGIIVLESSNKGFVITRISSAARDASSFVPVEGMLIYNTTVNRFQLRKAGAWVNLKRGCIN